jgi:pyruvate/2-oxoglutarate dehydrogenase complex dihydrolipoamide dehydrogenase (E3) component
MKKKKNSSVMEQVKAARKQSREEEIQTHGKSINYRKVMESKRQYNRKKNKADDEVLPYLFKVSYYKFCF